MKKCSSCNVFVNEDTLLCPLCVKSLEEENHSLDHEKIYPELDTLLTSYKFIKRLLLFISILAGGSSIVINLALNPSVLWSLIVISGIFYFWLAVSNVIRTNTNAAFKILFQTVCACILAAGIDYELGWIGWSVKFVIPGILCFGIIGVLILVLFNRTNWARYVLYQSITAFFGFLPIILYKTGVSDNFIMSIIPTGLAFVCLTITIVFGDRTIKNEFKRRIHF